MDNIIDLQGVALAEAMIAQALILNPNVFQRLTQENIEMIYKSELETQVLSIRMDRKLVEKIDQYAREQAVKRKERITRNSMIAELAELAMNALLKQKELHATKEATAIEETQP